MQVETSQMLRTDAQANRARILAAAAEAFAAHGLDVPMAAVARRAGVGVATLYRRFPTKQALVTEVFADQLETCAGAVDEAALIADPWQGFCHVIEQLAKMQVSDRGFTAAFLASYPNTIDVDGRREQAGRRFATLVEAAKTSGDLRRDFDPSDLVLVLLANNGLPEAASRRLVAYLLQSFRATNAGPLPPPGPMDFPR
ncbi:AcrR family transcriptional regulator [Crossiella equi]|uniref:AcrR family transcriptional regulator n=1 Tax=Crossiella equi TaxID=130796 RepID=A0ABS5AAT9_9PSEU|nr:TetR/AcrR family transcriptional regulator [Crossiella equi]MBP2473436.1 AcrR family transcriptional regulator [Crossiella equi]